MNTTYATGYTTRALSSTTSGRSQALKSPLTVAGSGHADDPQTGTLSDAAFSPATCDRTS
jgi:hypothetical protein